MDGIHDGFQNVREDEFDSDIEKIFGSLQRADAALFALE
jgi:hypothetical protein